MDFTCKTCRKCIINKNDVTFKHNCLDKCRVEQNSTVLIQTNLFSKTIKTIQNGRSQLYNEYDFTIYKGATTYKSQCLNLHTCHINVKPSSYILIKSLAPPTCALTVVDCEMYRIRKIKDHLLA